MLNKDSESIYEEYLALYKAEGIQLQADELRTIITKAKKESKANYDKLREPKTSLIDRYINYWVRQEITKDIAARTVKRVTLNNPPPSLKASAKYFSLLPYGLHEKLRKKLFNTKPDKRKALWENFDLPLDEIEKRFKEMTIERIGFARKKGFSSYADMHLDKYKIPKSDYEKFTKDTDNIIEYCHQQLSKINNLPKQSYNKLNRPCYICSISTFPFETLEEAQDHIVKKYKILDKFKDKIDVKLADSSMMFYKKETDSFVITLDKNTNTRHQIVVLIHELSHVIFYLRFFKKGKNPLGEGVYLREKEALETGHAFMERLSKPLYQAIFGESLLLFRRILFEVSLYTNPNQDLSKLYAKTFNRCFQRAKQNINPLFILDEYIVLKPFSTLPHAIAHASVIQGLIINQQSK